MRAVGTARTCLLAGALLFLAPPVPGGSQTDAGAAHFEQSFSADGGKTWEVNWITDQVRQQ